MDRDELLALGIGEEAADAIIGEREKVIDEYEKKISLMKRENEIDILLRENGARNIKAVKALLEEGDDFANQIERLKNGEDTKFLFEKSRKVFEPHRSGEKLPDTEKDGYELRLAQARAAGNTIEAIRIKQQAASEGIMLI